MKQFLTIVFTLFFLNVSFGQKKIEIPENDVVYSFIEKLPENLVKYNLKDLQVSTDSLNIRIWQTHKIFTISHMDSISSDYKIHTANTNNELIISSSHFSKNISQKILDSFLDYKIMEIKDEKYRGIDGRFVFFEISTKATYKIVSFWSPKSNRSDNCIAVVEILNLLNQTINSKDLEDTFLNSLEPGGYRWGMTSFKIDRFLSSDSVKTDFYIKSEERIKNELNITEKTNNWDYPLIRINNKPSKIADLNQYSEEDIKSFEIISSDNPMAAAIYGTNGMNGVVNLITN